MTLAPDAINEEGRMKVANYRDAIQRLERNGRCRTVVMVGTDAAGLVGQIPGAAAV